MAFWRDFIKYCLNKTPYRLTRGVGSSGASSTGLDLVLRMALGAGWPLTIVQIGANDGTTMDPLRVALRDHDFPTLFVEPIQPKLDSVRRLYEGRAGFEFAPVAVSDKAGAATIYNLPHFPGAPPWTESLASFNRKVILSHAHLLKMSKSKLNDMIESAVVETITMPMLFERFPDFQKAQLVQIDTEGHDDVIIGSLLETDQRPSFINFEHRHMTVERQDRIRSRLAEDGYSFVVSDMDTLCWREGSFQLRTPGSMRAS